MEKNERCPTRCAVLYPHEPGTECAWPLYKACIAAGCLQQRPHEHRDGHTGLGWSDE